MGSWDGFCIGREKVFGLSLRLYEACHLHKEMKFH
jgi:hypothetical protein